LSVLVAGVAGADPEVSLRVETDWVPATYALREVSSPSHVVHRRPRLAHFGWSGRLVWPLSHPTEDGWKRRETDLLGGLLGILRPVAKLDADKVRGPLAVDISARRPILAV
jgi:hypothetical protein